MTDRLDPLTFDHAGLGLTEATIDGRYTRANRYFCDLLGYREDELLGLGFGDVAHGGDAGPDPTDVARLLGGEIPWLRIRRCYARKDGSPLWARLTVSVRRDEGGQPLHYVDVVEDITAQVAAEGERDRLLEREAALALESEQARQTLRSEVDQKTAILEQMLDGVLVVDQDGRIVLANAGAARLLGQPVEAMLGLTPERYPWAMPVIDGGSAPPARERLVVRAIEGRLTRTEVRGRRRNGSTSWLDVGAAQLRDEGGRVVGAVLVFRDVTERHEAAAEAERVRARVAQSEKLRALGQMASGIAHDVNQSLALVAAYGDIAQDELDAADPDLDLVRSALEITTRAALEGGATLRRLLTFARGAGSDEAPTAIDVGGLLREVAELTAPRWQADGQAMGRRIQLVVDVPADLRLLGWEISLREALTNLIFNAVDALPDGGRIVLSAEQDGDTVVLRVADNGAGMTPEVRARVFEPFFTTKGEGGTGLGLPMVFGIVERHGGRIDVASAPGEGTSIEITLPQSRGVDPVPAAPAPAATAAMRVLVVDDEPGLRAAIATLLRRAGHEVLVAASGEEAIDLLEQGTVDAVISDVAMGTGMNGWDLAAGVKARWPNAYFVLSTGFGSEIDGEQARQRGVDWVLAKPYRPDDLARALAARPAPPPP